VRHKGSDNGNDKRPVKVLRCDEVVDRTGLSRPTIYRRMKDGEFPRCRRLSPGAVGWSEAEVEAWIKARFSDPEPP
jgi:prophage regulatory protein